MIFSDVAIYSLWLRRWFNSACHLSLTCDVERTQHGEAAVVASFLSIKSIYLN